MKLSIIYTVISCLFLTCNEPDIICETPILGSFTTNTNYLKWNNSSCIFNNSNKGTISLSFNSLDIFCNLKLLEFYNIEKSIGLINASNIKEQVVLTQFTGEDGILGWYKLDTNYMNKIEILKIDEQNEEIEGTFDLQFIVDHFVFPHQDTIYFKNGIFIAKLVE